MTKFHRNQAGDTIIEVLLAITILAVILTTSYALATRAFRTLQIARDQAQATFLAQEQIEAIKSIKDTMAFSSFVTYLSRTTDLDVAGCNSSSSVSSFNITHLAVGSKRHWCVRNASSNPTLPSQPLYTVSDTVTFADTDGSSGPDQATVVVRVTWAEIGSGISRTLSYTARFRDSGS